MTLITQAETLIDPKEETMDAITTDRIFELIQAYALPMLWALIIVIVGRIIARALSNARQPGRWSKHTLMKPW
jgi:hypothetical protein